MLLVRLTACFAVIAAHASLFAANFTVSGIVVNSVTNEPIPHALVQSTGAQQHVVFSGQDGRFQIENIPQGAVYFLPQKPGFMVPERQMPVKVGSDTSLVTVKLDPESSIDGRIIDNEGEAIGGLSVTCIMRGIQNGRKTWQGCGMAQSDETGNFHLQSLRPGAYLLRTSKQALFPNLHAQNANDALPEQAYPPHYYPEAADLSSAQPFVVRAGETARADFAIAPVPAFRVSGTISPAQRGIFGFMQSADGEPEPGGININPRTGAWQATVPAGTWTIAFQSRRGPDSDYSAEQTVTVTSSDVKNVQIALEPVPSIPVNINSPGPANQRQVQVQLIPDTPSPFNRPMFGSSRSPQNLSETPMVRGVRPGTYTVVAMPFGGDCLSSISSGGVDLTRNSLVVSGGSQPPAIDVALEDNCASIQGQVRIDNPTTSNASVILAPSSRALQPQQAPLQADGSFAFNRLSPGDYRLYAVSTIAGLEYGNPEAMRQIDGASVTLTAKQKASVTLNLVTRDGN